MQKREHSQTASSPRRKVQVSTTLNRRYVKKPNCTKLVVKDVSNVQKGSNGIVGVSVNRSPKITRFNDAVVNDVMMPVEEPRIEANTSLRIPVEAPVEMPVETIVEAPVEMPVEAPEVHPLQAVANERVKRHRVNYSTPKSRSMTAKQMKEQAIQKALAQASRPVTSISSNESGKMAKIAKKSSGKKSSLRNVGKFHFGFGRIMLAFSCTAIAVFAIVYFINLNMPDLSLKVAAMQTGIQASYPNYTPRDFKLSEITSEEGKIVLNFRNAETGDAYSIVEERSSWDSNALLTNFVTEKYGEDYSVLREQGLTIYVDGSNATWVNGGVLFKLTTTSGTLSKKQITSIVTSL